MSRTGMAPAFGTAEQWRKRGQMLRCADLRLFVCRHDSATASQQQNLVLIHGFPTASWDWHRVWADCNNEFATTLAMDMPGFGFSDKPAHLPYTLALQADLHERLLQQSGITHCHLLVHDYGVSVAQELLARQLRGTLDFRIRSCVFLNGGLFHGVHRPLLIQHLLASPLGPLLQPLLGKPTLIRSMRKLFRRPLSALDLEQMWSLISHQQGQKLIPQIIRYLHERKLYAQRWLEAMQRTDVPLHLIVGQCDPISGDHIATAWSKLIATDNITRLPDCGHYPQLECPLEVMRHCQQFWHRITASTAVGKGQQ